MKERAIRRFMRYMLHVLEEDGEEREEPREAAPLLARDIVTDFRIFAEDMYEGTVEEEQPDSLLLRFGNGQCFRVNVREVKAEVIK